ncbi:MAG: DUF4407 domain-containing protein [Acidobacteriota bacterium]|nr:DUF4407 domain-containing protein [Acidobacteriota bacterium]
MSSPFVTSEPRTRPSGNTGSSNGHHSGRSQQKTIYVSQQPQSQRIDGFLGFLVKLFHLDIYGTSQLTRCVLYELKAIALALSIMFLFDLAAWTFFWNMVLHNGRLEIGFYTIFAVLFALMFALIIVIYERQWVVTDLSRFTNDWKSAFKIGGAFCVRLFIIVLAAYATAQPIEVLFFNGQIQKRVHDESVRGEAIAQFRDYQDKVNKTKGAVAYKDTIEDQANQRAQTQLTDAQKEVGRLRENLRRAKEEVTTAQRRLSAAQNSRNTKNRAARIARAQEQLNRARVNESNAQTALDQNSGLLAGAETKATLTEEAIKGLQADAEREKQRITNWIKKLRNSNPGKPIIEERDAEPKFRFEDRDYDFFERMTIIDDLYWGRPPKWTGADQKEVEDLKREFAFGESADAARRDVDALSFQKQWIGLLVITFIFPLSVIAMKLLMSVDKSLMNYYSYDVQMENNDYAVHLENRYSSVEPDENGNSEN